MIKEKLIKLTSLALLTCMCSFPAFNSLQVKAADLPTNEIAATENVEVEETCMYGYYKNGWVKDSYGWRYYQNGKALSGNQLINGYWYHFGYDNYMWTGWYSPVDVVKYYYSTTGEMLTGWQSISGNWYYFNNRGQLQYGWQKIGSSWYYLEKNYWTGIMQTGWQWIDGSYYYFDNSGEMLTGWQMINGEWYYLNSNGSMQTDWKHINGYWYYFNSDGSMVSNQWKWIGNSCYYFYSDGSMAQNTYIDGSYVNSSGAWV